MFIDKRRGELFIARAKYEKSVFLSKIQKPIRAQLIVLEDLKCITKEAIYWKESGADLNDLSQLKKTVKISAYNDFEEVLKKESITKGGFLTNSPILRWLKTSGTTGKSKMIPYSYHWMSNYRIPAMYAMWDTFIETAPQILLSRFSVMDTQTSKEHVLSNINGLPYQSISNRYPYINDNDWDPPWNDEEWYGVNLPTEFDKKNYYRLRYFIKHDLRAITAINPSAILSLKDTLDRNLVNLINDVRYGTFCGNKSKFEPDSVTASKIEKCASKRCFNFLDIWPRLDFISCWTSAGASAYLSGLNDLIPDAMIVPFMTCGTEGVVTIPICPERKYQPLAVNQAVYEFIPADSDPEIWLNKFETNTLEPSQVEVGKKYHLIMSQGHGLLRLWTGDIFEIGEIRNGTPWLRFVERYGMYYSFTGEKLTHADVSQSISVISHQLCNRDVPYLICPKWGVVPFYIIAVEFEGMINLDDFSERIDAILSEFNVEYKSKRLSYRLLPPKIIACKKDIIRKVLETGRDKSNTNQFKYKSHQLDDTLMNMIEGFNNEKSS